MADQPQPQPQPQPNTPYKPAGLPDHLAGGSDRETIDKIFGAYNPLREQLAKIPQPPKDATGYAFEPTDPLKGYFSKKDDPMLNLARGAALKVGMPADMFGRFINETFGPAVEKKLLSPPYDPAKEMATLGKLIGAPEGPAGKDALTTAATEANAIATALAARVKLPDGTPDDVKAEIQSHMLAIADLPGGVLLLRQIKADMAEKGITLGGQPQPTAGALTKDQLEEMGRDPRTDPMSPKFDKTFRAKYDEGFKRLYGK